MDMAENCKIKSKLIDLKRKRKKERNEIKKKENTNN